MSTDHLLVVCTLKASRENELLFDHEKLIKSNGNHCLTKRYELHLQTTLHLSSKNFRPLLKTLKLNGVCFEQQSFRTLRTVSVLAG